MMARRRLAPMHYLNPALQSLRMTINCGVDRVWSTPEGQRRRGFRRATARHMDTFDSCVIESGVWPER